MQPAAPISVLLDNLAVPSEARIRSICFPRSCLPCIRMRLDGFPGCALATRAAGSLCYCGFKKDRARTADGQPGSRERGTAPFPARHASFFDLKMLIVKKCNLGRCFQKRTWSQGLVDLGSRASTGRPQALVRNQDGKSMHRAGNAPLISGILGYNSRSSVV